MNADQPLTPRLPLPRSVRVGAALVFAYGVAVVINAAIQQSLGGWEYWHEFTRALIRFSGCTLVAYGLTRLSLWAWWLVIIVGGSAVLLGVLGAVGFSIGSHYSGEQLPVMFLVRSTAILGLLATGIVCLLRRSSREVFRVPADHGR